MDHKKLVSDFMQKWGSGDIMNGDLGYYEMEKDLTDLVKKIIADEPAKPIKSVKHHTVCREPFGGIFCGPEDFGGSDY